MEEIQSGLFYVNAFLLSCLFFWAAESNGFYEKKKNWLCIVFLGLAVLIPCLIAGLRGIDVGKDTKNYIVIWRMALSAVSPEDIGRNIPVFDGETGLKWLSFYISRFTNDIYWFFGAYQLLTIAPLVRAVRILNGRVSLPLAMGTYLFCYFNSTLNATRQSAAVAFIIVASVDLFFNPQKQNWKQVLWGIFEFYVAILLHKAAFIGILLVVLINYLCKSSFGLITKVIFYVLAGLFAAFHISIVLWMAQMGLLNYAFEKYANIFIFKTKDSNLFVNPFDLYCLVDVFCRLILFVPPMIYLRRNKEKVVSFLKTTVIFGFSIFYVVLLMLRTNYGQRISMFLDMFVILLIPMNISNDSKNTRIALIWASIFVYFVLWIMLMGWSASRIYSIDF